MIAAALFALAAIVALDKAQDAPQDSAWAAMMILAAASLVLAALCVARVLT